jgi:DNA-binding NarL/FixJ family response regulator
VIRAESPDLVEVKPESAILVLTLVSMPAKIQAVLAAGADGYLLKTANAEELITGIALSVLRSSNGVRATELIYSGVS